jgi:nitrite reductase/ring-hydroxylating ferredoxin subunit
MQQMQDASTNNDNYITVTTLSQIKRAKKQVVQINKRNITIVYYKNTVYAIDEYCYHHGGPLSLGDIEELDQHVCIVCPWHHYKISLETGEGLYLGLKREVKTKGVKQRIHLVRIDENENVLVKLNTDSVTIESDRYKDMDCIRNPQQRSTVNLRELKQQRMNPPIHSTMPDLNLK